MLESSFKDYVSFPEKRIRKTLRGFFEMESGEIDQGLLVCAMKKIDEITRFFAEDFKARVFGVSILFYRDNTEGGEHRFDLRMIDFTYILPINYTPEELGLESSEHSVEMEVDENTLMGLVNLGKMIKELQE